MGMHTKTKMRVGSILGVALLVGILAFASPLITGSVAYANETTKDLKDDNPVLDTDLGAGNYTVTYVYRDTDGEKVTDELTQDPTIGATTVAFNAELRVLGIDFAGVNLTATPEYKDSAPFDHYVVIELPEVADILWEETVRSWCFGFALIRGDTAATVDAQDYKVEVGAGESILHSLVVEPEDEEIGDADTNEEGSCQGRSDPTDTDPEYDGIMTVPDIQKFLLSAYVNDDPKEPEAFWVKIYGPRFDDPTVNATEVGDAFDFGIQFYNWGAGQTTYDEINTGRLVASGIGFAGALLMTTWLNLPKGDIVPHQKKIRTARRD